MRLILMFLGRNSVIQSAKIQNVEMTIAQICRARLMNRFGGKEFTNITIVEFAFKIENSSLSVTFVMKLEKRLSTNNLKNQFIDF